MAFFFSVERLEYNNLILEKDLIIEKMYEITDSVWLQWICEELKYKYSFKNAQLGFCLEKDSIAILIWIYIFF